MNPPPGNFPNQRDRMIRQRDTTTRTAMSEDKQPNTAGTTNPTLSAPHDPEKKRYRTTAEHRRPSGMIWPKGMVFWATPKEVTDQKIPAELVTPGPNARKLTHVTDAPPPSETP